MEKSEPFAKCPGMLSERPCVLLSWCPGVLVPACVDIVWAGYGTPWPGLDYHKEWGWLAAYKKDARQTRQHTLGHTRALIFPVCVFLKGGDASNIEQPFQMTTIRSARQGGRGSLIAVHYAVGICALGTQCYCLKGRWRSLELLPSSCEAPAGILRRRARQTCHRTHIFPLPCMLRAYSVRPSWHQA